MNDTSRGVRGQGSVYVPGNARQCGRRPREVCRYVWCDFACSDTTRLPRSIRASEGGLVSA